MITPLLNLWRDARYALRMMVKSPAVSAVMVLTLAVGIGATTVMFSVIDAIILEPYTYKEPGRIAHFMIHDVTRPRDRGRTVFSAPELMDFAEQNHVFEEICGIANQDVLYSSGGTTELLNGAWVTGNMFHLHGVEPLLGRAITPEDAKPGASPVFVMSDRLWNKEFGRDPKILNTVFTFNGAPTTLVGIMPPRFLVNNRDVWMPIALSHAGVNNSQSGFPMYFIARARLKPGVTLQQAHADIDVIARRLSTVYQKDYPQQFSVLTMDILDWTIGDSPKMLYTLMAAVAMLLLIACSNVANLLLARSTIREREIAIRATLGAGRAWLIRQLLVESLVLSLIACGLGCVFAYFGLKLVVAYLPPGAAPPNAVFVFNARALLFAVAIALPAALLCGLAPALHAARGDLYGHLAGSGKGSGGGYGHGKLRSGLVIGEVALSIVLLIGSGLMVRTLLATLNLDLGFNPANVLVARIATPTGRYDTADKKKVFFREVMRRVTALPGVVSATVTNSFPPYGGFDTDITVPGKTHVERWNSVLDLCSEDYLQTVGLHLLNGRALSEVDVESARHVAVINQQFARKYLGDENPIGRTVKFNFLDRVADAPHDAYFEIIGVVGDYKNQGLQEQPAPQALIPYSITGAFGREIFVRTAGDPLAMLATFRKEVWAVDSSVAITGTGTVAGFLQQFSYAGPEFELITIGAFAGIGMLLVIIGIFGVMGYNVSLQTHEIGIRMALGAQQRDVLGMVIKRGLMLIACGVLIGLLASFLLTRLIASQIWGVTATDPLTFAAVVAVVLIVGLAACFAPARRATQVDPLIALRYE